MDKSLTFDFEEKLIQLVQERPFLYDKKRSDFKDALKKLNGWTGIAEILGREVDFCKQEWEGLRKQYTTFLKKLDKPTGSAAPFPAPYFRHHKTMDFYRCHYRPHRNKTISNFQPFKSSDVLANNAEIDGDNSEVNETDDGEFSTVYTVEDVGDLLEINGTRVMAEKDHLYSVDATPARKVTKRKANEDFEKKFISLYEKKIAVKEDEFYHFGLLIAEKLRQLNGQPETDILDIQLKILELMKSKQAQTNLS